MRASDDVRIRRQFRSYEKPQDEICVGDRVYCAVLPPQGNSRKLQLTWSGPVIVSEIINNALIKVQEYDVRNPRTYVAHRSKVRVAKKSGEKDVDPMFKLPRIPAEAVKHLAEELSVFELPARQLDAELVDEFHSQRSEINQRGRDHHSSISSNPPIVPQDFSGSSIAASSEDSEDGLFQSFVQSPGSTRSDSSNPEQLFQNHFQAQDDLQNETAQEARAEAEELTSAADLIPDSEPVKTPEPENSNIRGRDDDRAEINTPTEEQSKQRTRSGGEIPERMNSPPKHNREAAESPAEEVAPRSLDGSSTTEETRRRSSRVSVPIDRYEAEFKKPGRIKKASKSSLAKSLKEALKESWAQRPDTTAPLRRRSRSRESSNSTRTRAASLERVQTGSILSRSSVRNSVRSSIRTRYEVANQGSYVQGAEESSWSDTEDEADNSSKEVRKGINTISGQKSSIAKVKNSVTLHPGQGAWVYLDGNQGQGNGNDFIFPILFNTVIERNLFASKFSPRAGVLRSPAIYLINHNNDIFVQVKKGESVGKLVSLSVTCQNGQPATKASGVQE